MTNWNKVYAYLREEQKDKYQEYTANRFLEQIKANKIGMGKVLRHLIKAAERGEFKKDVKEK